MHVCRGSNQVRAFGYEPKTQTFDVQFHDGRTYRYSNVPRNVFDGFLRAPSKGGYINAQIKGKYAFERV